jgi:hypothetical protein
MLYAIVVCACLILVTLFWMVKPNYFFASTVGIPVFSELYLSLLVVSLVDKNRLRACSDGRLCGNRGGVILRVHYPCGGKVDGYKYVRGDVPRFDNLSSIAVTVLAFGHFAGR